MGGSYINGTAYCTQYDPVARNTTADPIGFRCCHE
jgi:hypothetical protein